MTLDNSQTDDNEETLFRVTNIVAAYVRKNPVPAPQLGPVIRLVYEALVNVGAVETASGNSALQPAISIRKSITPDYLICLEDGRHLKMLKRYLRSHYKMTPDQYRAKWGLPGDYPMVAPNYARQRSDFAKKIGLGRSNAN